MSTQTTALTAAGASAAVSLQPGQSVTYSSSGAFTGYVRFQISRNQGASWETVQDAAVDTNLAGGTWKNESNAEQRFRFAAYDTDALTAWTGTCTTVVTDNTDVVRYLKDDNGRVYAKVTDDGVEFLGTVSIADILTVVGNITAHVGVEDTLTAHAGGTQAAALALSATAFYHRISVCATAGDSVILPAATVGRAHFIRNDGAASAQVYAALTETINGVASATGVPLGAGSGVWYVCTTAGKWTTAAGDELAGKWQVNASGALVPNVDNTYDIGNGSSDPRDLNLKRHAYIGGLLELTGVENALTAHAGGTKAAALALSAVKNYHRISVCATQDDSVLMPAATVGQAHFVRNDGATAARIFGAGTDTINGVATATGVSMAPGTGAWFVCTTAGEWNTTGLVEQYVSAAAACTGAVLTSVSWKVTKSGKAVTLTLPQTIGAGVAVPTITYAVALPAEFRPSAIINAPVLVQDNGARLLDPGRLMVDTNGVITVEKDNNSSNFTVTADAGLQYAHSVSWML